MHDCLNGVCKEWAWCISLQLGGIVGEDILRRPESDCSENLKSIERCRSARILLLKTTHFLGIRAHFLWDLAEARVLEPKNEGTCRLLIELRLASFRLAGVRLASEALGENLIFLCALQGEAPLSFGCFLIVLLPFRDLKFRLLRVEAGYLFWESRESFWEKSSQKVECMHLNSCSLIKSSVVMVVLHCGEHCTTYGVSFASLQRRGEDDYWGT
jgi:hypothetical protein